MAEMFYGDWTVEVFQHGAVPVDSPGGRGGGFGIRRFHIEGSLASGGGGYAWETATPPISVSGPSWFIRFNWVIDNVWKPFDLRRTGAAYTLQDGLVVFLGLRHHDIDYGVLRCRNVDRKLTPWYASANPYDFTLPKQRRPRPPIR